MNGLDPSGPGDAASGMTALIFHLVVTGVLLPALIDYVRHRMTAGRTLLRWQPSIPCYYRALRRHGERPPLDALIVITAGYAALLALGKPVWQLHVLFGLLALAALMPPLYWVSERGVLILRPRLPWRRELSPWQFRWDDVGAIELDDDGVVLHVDARWPGGPPHRRILPSDNPAALIALVPTLVPAHRRSSHQRSSTEPAPHCIPYSSPERVPGPSADPAADGLPETTPDGSTAGETAPVQVPASMDPANTEDDLPTEPAGETSPRKPGESVPPSGSDRME